MPDGGNLKIACRRLELDESTAGASVGQAGKYAQITVSDTGCGMTPKVRERVFEPFFTTKEAGRGTGLGLSIAYGTIQQSGGDINVKSKPNEGTMFTIQMPIADQKKAAIQSPKTESRGLETILVVDDEPLVLKSLTRLLQLMGYSVLTATNGGQGLEVYRSNSDEIDLILTDSVMPTMGGPKLIQSIFEENQDARAIVLSGNTTDLPDNLQTKNTIIMQKPVQEDELHLAIRRLLDS